MTKKRTLRNIKCGPQNRILVSEGQGNNKNDVWKFLPCNIIELDLSLSMKVQILTSTFFLLGLWVAIARSLAVDLSHSTGKNSHVVDTLDVRNREGFNHQGQNSIFLQIYRILIFYLGSLLFSFQWIKSIRRFNFAERQTLSKVPF